MNLRNESRNSGRQSGIAMVELVIVLPVLLFMFLATAELGRVLFQYNTLTKSVRYGARHAAQFALLGTTGVVNITNQLEDDVDNLVVHANIGGSGATLLPGLSAGDVTVIDAGGGDIQVSASYTYQPMIGPVLPDFDLAGGGVPLTFTLQATVQMRAL
jgi:hypothetical protein